jgi:diaminopimelate decarboxylase
MNNNNSILQSAPALVQQFGAPLFVYDAQKIQQQYQRLSKAFDRIPIHIHYALKALNNINILKLLLKEGAGMDAVSINEIYLALRAGCPAEKIIYTPNCVSFDEIEVAIQLGVVVNLDNLSVLEKFGEKYKNSVPCFIRLNPHIMAGGNANISVGHIDSKFGISIHQLRHVLRIVKHYNIKVIGLHMHTGSDILDADVFLSGAEIIFDAAKEFEHLSYLDFGSGFKVAYKEGDITTDIEQLADKLQSAFLDFCKETGKDIQLIFEPGKFLVSEAGYLLVKANVIKQTTSTVFVGVDSGQNHLIRPMFYNSYHHITNTSNTEGNKRIYSIVGYICETDTLGYDRALHEVQEGDVLAIHNAGAYSYTMSNQYNARTRPAEVLLLNNTAQLIRKAETLNDIIMNEVELEF